MPAHKTASREEWQAARDELAKLEAEHAKRSTWTSAYWCSAPCASRGTSVG